MHEFRLCVHGFLQIMLDLVFPFEVPVTFRLIEGSGPVHLTANELIGEVPDCMEWYVHYDLT